MAIGYAAEGAREELMFQAINRRDYYLLHGLDGYRKHVYHGKHKRLEDTLELFSQENILAIAAEVECHFLKRIHASRLMRLFWQQANHDIRTGLLFSYWMHGFNKGRKGVNVEVATDWMKDAFFEDYFTKTMRRARLSQAWRLRTYIANVWRIIGKHHHNIRFDNIHLTVDVVGSRRVFGVHWDNHCPKPWTLGGVAHLLFDDIRS